MKVPHLASKVRYFHVTPFPWQCDLTHTPRATCGTFLSNEILSRLSDRKIAHYHTDQCQRVRMWKQFPAIQEYKNLRFEASLGTNFCDYSRDFYKKLSLESVPLAEKAREKHPHSFHQAQKKVAADAEHLAATFGGFARGSPAVGISARRFSRSTWQPS